MTDDTTTRKPRRKNPKTLVKDITEAQLRLNVTDADSVGDLINALKDEFFKETW